MKKIFLNIYNKMKIILTILFLIFGILSLYFLFDNWELSSFGYFQIWKNTQIYNSKNITVIKTKKSLEFYYKTWNLFSAEELANQENLNYVVNWSYFWYTGNDDQEYIHAGYLKLNNKVVTPIKTWDTNITHFVIYQKAWNRPDKLFFLDNDTKIFNYSWLIFQAWPLLLSWNKIQYDSINQAMHSGWKYYRTMLWYDYFWYKYLIVIKKRSTLIKSVDIIKNVYFLPKSWFNIINLDWWPSVSMYSSTNKKFNFRSDKKLPIFIWIK